MDDIGVFFLGLIFLFLVVGGGQAVWNWLSSFFNALRGYLDRHPGIRRGSSVLAFLTGFCTAFVFYADHPRQSESDHGLIAVIAGCLAAFLSLPLWFVATHVVALFYYTILRGPLEVLLAIFASIVAVIAWVVQLFRRRADAVQYALVDGPRRQAEQEAAEEASRRRENARARCEMFFTLHAPEIGKRFPKTMFDDHLRRYLGDDRSPDDVEARAEQFLDLLRQQLEKVQPSPKFKTLEDIARWFEEQKRQLDALPEGRERRALLAMLKERYTELTTQFLQEMRS
jgi:hypothetical protein